MISASQIRAARAAVGWTADDLAAASGVSRRTLGTIESSDGVPPVNASTLGKIQRALELQGIEFINRLDKPPGILIHAKPRP